jgi:hypothetical protein
MNTQPAPRLPSITTIIHGFVMNHSKKGGSGGVCVAVGVGEGSPVAGTVDAVTLGL